ncbi:TFIIB-type zinc ribbon-containing protein [Cellulomonas wangsupingiae]|uniref:Zf-TFIIB domain-containing protein n=1 Tax=Cellulomonas wangsupingiae TaxID=2968085 RepID=A0ABY5K620_9CELL|nr:zf-TFIIB domain-containing protein [Cellulomonas wangsupingiae]MCC2333985.1 zf-TFIIB domain-containing protein [Cellulomonas wangsupingiae]MCM0640959.1 zf-TFIIB domain-containing protein [Cellulomonas wangsupingiae]UUI65238.1 zf-TFIIB domain-containing protein [Cellulomonas wangsupingiae]
MQCPVDQAQLVMTERQGVEIDYCPVCRGIWLDRGELDKIIDRAAPAAPGVDPRAVPGASVPDPRVRDADRYGSYEATPDRGYDRGHDRDDRRGYDRGGYGDRGKRKKRESWLEDLFDF